MKFLEIERMEKSLSSQEGVMLRKILSEKWS